MTVEWRYNRVQRGVVCPTTEPVKPKLPKRFKCTRGSQTPKTAKHLHKLLAKKLKTKMFKNINRNSGLPIVYKMCVLKSFPSKLPGFIPCVFCPYACNWLVQVILRITVWRFYILILLKVEKWDGS